MCPGCATKYGVVFYLWLRRNQPIRGAIYVTSSPIVSHWLRPCLAMDRKLRCHDLWYPRDTWRPGIGHAYCRHSHRPLGKNMTSINTAQVVTYFPQTCHVIHLTISQPVDVFMSHSRCHRHYVEYSPLPPCDITFQNHRDISLWYLLTCIDYPIKGIRRPHDAMS